MCAFCSHLLFTLVQGVPGYNASPGGTILPGLREACIHTSILFTPRTHACIHTSYSHVYSRLNSHVYSRLCSHHQARSLPMLPPAKRASASNLSPLASSLLRDLTPEQEAKKLPVSVPTRYFPRTLMQPAAKRGRAHSPSGAFPTRCFPRKVFWKDKGDMQGVRRDSSKV